LLVLAKNVLTWRRGPGDDRLGWKRKGIQLGHKKLGVVVGARGFFGEKTLALILVGIRTGTFEKRDVGGARKKNQRKIGQF